MYSFFLAHKDNLQTNENYWMIQHCVKSVKWLFNYRLLNNYNLVLLLLFILLLYYRASKSE